MKDRKRKIMQVRASAAGATKIAGTKLASVASTTVKAAKGASASVISEGSRLAQKATGTIQDLQINHEKIAEHAKTIEDVSKIVAGVAAAGATIAAPTGLAAVGVALGITSAPLAVTAAPVLITVAGTAATVSAVTRLYSKSKTKGKTGKSKREAQASE